MELAASTSTASGSLAQHGHALQLVRPVGPFFPVRVLWQRIRRPEQKPRNNSALVSAKEQAGELANEVPGASLGMSKVEAHCADYGSICSTTSQQQKGPAQHDSQQHAPGPRLVRPVRFIGRMLRAAWRQVGNGARAVARHVRPQGPGDNDQTLGERVLNVITCLPFFTVANEMARHCRKPLAHRFGKAFLVVGVVASTYHSASGRARIVLRMADYWSVAYSSGLLRRLVYSCHPASSQSAPLGAACPVLQPTIAQAQSALPHQSLKHAAITASMLQCAVLQRLRGVVGAPTRQETTAGSDALTLQHTSPKGVGPHARIALQRVLGGVTTAAIPFFPSKVTTLNLVLAELRFVKLMLGSPHELFTQWALHAALSLSAVTCFSLEGTTHVAHLPPVLHAAWHALAAGGMVTTAPFLVHLEQLEAADGVQQ